MFSRYFKRIADFYTGIKQNIINTGKSSDVSEAFAGQRGSLGRVAAISAKIMLYALIPFYVVFVLIVGLTYIMCRAFLNCYTIVIKG